MCAEESCAFETTQAFRAPQYTRMKARLVEDASWGRGNEEELGKKHQSKLGEKKRSKLDKQVQIRKKTEGFREAITLAPMIPRDASLSDTPCSFSV